MLKKKHIGETVGTCFDLLITRRSGLCVNLSANDALIRMIKENVKMEEMCVNCWNEGCKCDEKLRARKVDVCRDMHEHPEDWDYDDNPVEYNFWDDRTWC